MFSQHLFLYSNSIDFQEILPLVEEAIGKADFLSFDAEFTGLRRDATFAYNELDSAEER